MERTVNFALAGCGSISKIHAECINALHHAKLVGVFDKNTERAEQFCKQFPAKIFANLEDMLDRPDIDVVSILTPSGLHGDIGIKAAKAKKNIIVEKPLEITKKKARLLLDAVRENNVKLCCISQHRFDHSVKQLKKAIDDGELGQLNFGAAHTKWYRDQAYYDSSDWRGTWAGDGGGAVMNQSIHYIDLLRYLMGEVEEVSAYCATRAHRNIEVEDIGAAAVKFCSGALGLIEGNTAAYPGFCTRLDIYGSNGGVVIENDRIKEWRLKSGLSYAEPGESKKIITGNSNPEISNSAHMEQYKDMVEAVLNHREPSVNGEDAFKTLLIIFAIYQSAKEGKPIKLSECEGIL